MSSNDPNLLICPAVPELPEHAALPALPFGRRWRWGWRIFLILLGVLFIALLPLVYGGVRAGLAASRLRKTIVQIQVSATALDFAMALSQLHVAEQEVNEIQSGLRATMFWQQTPLIGTQLRSLEEVARAGSLTVTSLEGVIGAAATIQDAFATALAVAPGIEVGVAPQRSFRDLSPDEKRAILARIADVLPDLRVAREKLAIAIDAWQRIPADQLAAPVREALLPVSQVLPELKTRLDETVSLAEVLLPMAGYPKEKRYLVLLQNADELRPTGGFIGNIGVLDVDAATLQHVEFQDVYAVDGAVQTIWKAPPPEILHRELGVNAWFLRDSNWSPDFPQAAEQAMDFYLRERALAAATSTSFDGVIALQPGFFKNLLQFTGPLQVGGKTFTADNFFTELQYDVEVGFLSDGTPVNQRKEIVAQVGDALLATLMDQPASRWPELMRIVLGSFEAKDILLYDRDPGLLTLLDARGWTGRTRASEQDYLWVVDANLAAFKTDGVMDKEVRYAFDATNPSNTIATVTLHYQNTNKTFNWRYTRYRDYVRVYVPEGSELISSDGAMLSDKNKTGGVVVPGKIDVTHDLGKTVFGAFWAIEPGETRDLRFTYRLPAQITDGLAQGTYHLLAQKQPGSRSRLTLDLSFGKNLQSAEPAEEEQEFGDSYYRVSTPLDTDRTFDVRF